MNSIYRNIILTAAAAAAFTAQAQDLSTEITVDRTIRPQEHTAAPLQSVKPLFIRPAAPKTDIRPTEYTLLTPYKPTAGTAGDYSYNGLSLPADFRGYVRAGYFPAYNLGFDMGYRILDGKTDRLGVAASFEGQSHNSHAASQNRTVADNTFGVQADYSHEFDNGSVLTAMADYMHSGLKSPSTALRSAPLSDLGLPGAAPFTVATLDRAQKQNIDAFAASVAYSTHNTPVALSATAYVDHFALGKDIVSPLDIIPESRFSPARQTRFGLDASASGKISGGAGYAFRLDAGFMDGRDRLTERTMGIIGLNPALTFTYSHINARLGARMDISVNSPDQTFHGSPDIYFGWQPSGRLSLYASLGGGERFNTLRRLYNYSPFAPGAQTFRNSFTPVDGRAGFVAGSFGGVTAEIYVRYCAARRLPMPVLTDQGLSFELTNLSGWSAGLRLDYTFSDKIKAGAYADFYPHSYASGVPDALDRASVCAGMSVSVLAMPNLTLDASYDFRGGRRYYARTISEQMFGMSMGNVSDLSIGADYRFSSALSAGLRLENLLCRRPEILPGITDNGLHGLLSATYRF